MHQQKRSLHYASLREAPVGMTGFLSICPALAGEKSMRSIPLRDLRRLFFLRLLLRVRHDRRVLELRQVLLGQHVKARRVLAADGGAHGELLGERIDLLAAAMELVVQMRA